MKKPLLGLLFAAFLTPLVSGQSTSHAKWSDDHTIVVSNLPDAGHSVSLPVTSQIRELPADLKATCEKMSNDLATWQLNETGTEILITPNRALYPQWTSKDWERYFNRTAGVYLLKR